MDGRWKHGPDFLRRPKDEWPEEITANVTEDPETKKLKPIEAAVSETPVIDLKRFSCWQKLLRVTAYCFKFISQLKQKLKDSASLVGETLQPDEFQKAEHYWVIVAQMGMDDWKQRFQDLASFLKEDVIKVGGRLRNSPLEYDQTHPMLLPASHPIDNLIMTDTHLRMGHVGAERTLCECRRKFWIVRGRNLAKGIVRKYVVCRKLRQRSHTTLMADLPPERLRPFSPPFSVTGVDLFGPFQLKYGRNKSVKAWGAVFTCATTRAIHLEIVDGSSTPAFLHA